MKKFLLISILFFLSAFSIIAQSSCPTISVTPPNGQTKIEGSMTFTAKVDGISLENLKYQWTVSSGEIISGQETLKLNVATTEDMAGQTVTATIQVSGLPQNCSKEFYGFGEIETKPPIERKKRGFPYDYGAISWKNEKLILDNVANALRTEDGSRVIFRVELTMKNYLQTFRIKSESIRKYLIVKHKIAKDRIIIVFGGNQDNRTEIYFVPKGVTIPF